MKMLDRTDTRTDPHWQDYDWGEKGNEWPIYFTGWVEGVESSYDFDRAFMAIADREGMTGLVSTDSESSQIFLYAKTNDAADWIEATVTKFEERLHEPTLDTVVQGW